MKARFELSRKKVLEQYEKLLDYCDKVSFSFKTNLIVSKILEKETGCEFSLHNLREWDLVKDKSRVLYFAQGWNPKEILKVLNGGTTGFVVDNEQDLNIFLETIRETHKKVNLFLRMRLKEHTVQTGKHFVYGMYSDQVNKLIPELKKEKNIDKLGIHFHRKTQNISEWSLKEELEQCLNKETLETISFANFGGGLPAVYKNYRPGTIDNIFERIKKAREWLKKNNIKVILEPGRFICAPAIKLITEVKAIYDNNIIVNASVYNSAMDTFVAHIRLLVENELEKGTPYTIKGQTPCSVDIFRYRVYLKEPKVGDKIVFLNAGAYNFNADFCCLEKLETVIVD